MPGLSDMHKEKHMNKPLTQQERATNVAQANANSAIEGATPDAADLANQAAYVAGTLSAGDLVEIAKQAAQTAVKKQNQQE